MKYKLTVETKTIGETTLYRIQALKDFRDVKAGDLGGWVEKEDNLSQDGYCWVSGNARVRGRKDLLVIDSIGSEDGALSAFKQSDGSIAINRGCFRGSLDEFEEAVKKRHGDNIHAQIYLALIPIIKLRLTQVA